MLRVVPANHRVDRIQFNPKVEYTDHIIHIGAYTCPKCKKQTEFNTGHLRRFENVKESPLGSTWSQRCEVARPLGAWEWAMDFKCPNCKSSVRIIYRHDGEFAMGAWMYRVTIPPAKPEACKCEPLKAVDNYNPPGGGTYRNRSS